MEKITGIKSVDFKITAFGHGVVNWNGPTTLKVQEDSKLGKSNHTMPKLRGYTNLTGEISEKGYKHVKEPTDVDFRKTPLYISQNCIRHHLFRAHAFDLHYAKERNLQKVLASVTGLIRGYVVPESQCKRTSPLLLEDFVDQLGNGNFEQFSRSGKRDSSSFFSKTTFGDTQYISYGSISIEQLQFISLDNKFERAAMLIKDNEGEVIAKVIEDFIQSLKPTLKPKAEFHPNYVRKGTIFEIGEAGILLNQDAIQALVEATLEMIKALSIRQAKSYMYVDDVIVDFNNSNQMMRIKRTPDQISPIPEDEYAVYFESKEV
ncbi:type I-Fv CRISPR-associated protein Cas7fv [Legionella pneumophila]|uniref:type I-Fv CRISPR-associated protein Cas7fv n=1 Tax=Legionella pneumophila TaxID=446 RepID=UPI0001D205C7|nr:type I-Fv CRISPR-associated protein Cas7fv [Legionella pneumophila]HAT9524569.1 hypothetical protein [Legionella pneumophila subsp. pneumophila]ADG24313.1 hypothetical protein lpa_01474 [Legionella pneumophila 2300/99 Alcoy]MCW8456939.1 type I-Fv CRISPR-associated protein Cas7fv [Legionella pneumophila]HAT8591723.1 hypothetical protein [Legionella pneumophila]HAT8810522.1 hypothetical protein [Legionella pneumophila]